jgi:hypothetical protein
VLVEVLLDPGGFVVARQLRVDTLGDDLGAKRPGGASGDGAVEDTRHLGRPANIEVVADQALEEGPAGLGAGEHAGVGDLELAHRELIAVAGPQVGGGERVTAADAASATRTA